MAEGPKPAKQPTHTGASVSAIAMCSLCTSFYDDEFQLPRSLSCGHTFCECCVSGLLNSTNPSKQASHANGLSAEAPKRAQKDTRRRASRVTERSGLAIEANHHSCHQTQLPLRAAP